MKKRMKLLKGTIAGAVLLIAGGTVALAGAPEADSVALERSDDVEIPKGLKKTGPKTCTTTKDIVIKKKHIKTDDDGAMVMGSCDITIIDSYIEAGKNGAHIMGSGDITIRNSVIKAGKNGVTNSGSGDFIIEGSTLIGEKAGIAILGSGDARVKDSKIEGGVTDLGTGEIIDEGGNNGL